MNNQNTLASIKKELVFIGWNRDLSLAEKVRAELNNLGYTCVIGGSFNKNPNEMGCRSSVQETVQYQMEHCSFALMLLRKTDDTAAGTPELSGNIMIEIGYFLAKFGNEQASQKLQIFNIDNVLNSDNIPSDISGIWTENLFSCDFDNATKLAKRVAAIFDERISQLPSEDKMSIISNYHRIEYVIDFHLSRPQVSDNELAKRIVLYAQAAYLYNDVSSAKRRCDKFSNSLQYKFSCRLEDLQRLYPELTLALKFAETDFRLFNAATPCDEHQRVEISYDTFSTILRQLKRCVLKALKVDQHPQDYEERILAATQEDSFAAWLIAHALGHIAYLYLLFFDSPAENFKIDDLHSAIKNGLLTKEVLKQMGKIDSTYIKLLTAFNERNLSIFYKMLKEEKEALKYIQCSYENKMELKELFEEIETYNPTLKEYIELEYCMQAAEIFPFEKNEREKEFLLNRINEFIEAKKSADMRKNLLFNRLAAKYKDLIRLSTMV